MYHHGGLKEALITAAITLLAEKQDFSLREVARHAGVSHNAPYNHFSSKQDLLAAVAASGFDRLRMQMEAAADAGDSAEMLRSIGVAYVGFGAANRALYRLMFGAALAGPDDCLPPSVEKSAAAAKALLRSAIRQTMIWQGVDTENEDRLDIAVLTAWALVHGLTLLLTDGLAIDGLAGEKSLSVTAPAAEQIAGQVTQILLDGLKPHTKN